MIVIVSSSRSGSTLLHRLLANTGLFCYLRSEHTPLYKIFGLLDEPDGDGFTIPDVPGFIGAILDNLVVDERSTPDYIDDFVQDLTRYLFMQWHQRLPDPGTVVELITRSIRRHEATHGSFDPRTLLLDVIRKLRAEDNAINPWYYDLPPSMVADAFPGLLRPSRPPALDALIEEPPFIVPAPARHASMGDLARRPVLLKAPVDAYRLPLLRGMFPHARRTVVHLVRQPAPTINGLINGWLDRGFYSHVFPRPGPLHISGYSHTSYGRRWWNFDLPPDWPDLLHLSLPEVCATQWANAHRAILHDVHPDDNYVRIRAEDVLVGGESRRHALRAVLHGADTPFDERALDGDCDVLMTSAPTQRRRFRTEAMATALTSPRILETKSLLDQTTALSAPGPA